MSGLQRCD